MHTLIDLRGIIPTFVAITTGKVNDVKLLDKIPVQEDAIYTMDRGYVVYTRLYAIHKQGAFFVIRAKDNLKFKRLYSAPKDKEAGIRARSGHHLGDKEIEIGISGTATPGQLC